MGLIKETGVSFKKGEALPSSSLNAMNNTINELVNVVNKLLQSNCNINLEIINSNEGISLIDAVNKIPADRRQNGMIIRINSIDYGWSEWMFTGGKWDSESSWKRIGFYLNKIDGGTI